MDIKSKGYDNLPSELTPQWRGQFAEHKGLLMEQSVNKLGVESQIKQAIEEMAELIVALHHFGRKKAVDTEVIEEIVDVSLMMEQLRLIFDNNHRGYEMMERSKLIRLGELLSSHPMDQADPMKPITDNALIRPFNPVEAKTKKKKKVKV